MVVLLSGVTAGILAGPMFGGLIIVCLALWDRKSPRPQVGTVFQGFGYFVQTLLMFLVWFAILIIPVVILSIIPVIGQIAVMALALAVQAFLMFAVFLIVERNMGFWEASMESIHTVLGNLWPFLGFGVLAAVIGNIGSFVCGIGANLHHSHPVLHADRGVQGHLRPGFIWFGFRLAPAHTRPGPGR